MKIKLLENTAELYTPYNMDFVKAIKQINGAKWSASNKCWTVPIDSVPSAREIMRNIYGCSDTDSESCEKLNIRISVPDGLSSNDYGADVIFCGKTLSHATGRDSGGKAGEDVFYISGKPTSGGSRSSWISCVDDGSIIDLVNVSKNLYDAYMQNPNSRIEILSVEQVGTIYKTALETEKTKLLARIAEIDKLLNA